jgi:hypothetical protein
MLTLAIYSKVNIFRFPIFVDVPFPPFFRNQFKIPFVMRSMCCSNTNTLYTEREFPSALTHLLIGKFSNFINFIAENQYWQKRQCLPGNRICIFAFELMYGKKDGYLRLSQLNRMLDDEFKLLFFISNFNHSLVQSSNLSLDASR